MCIKSSTNVNNRKVIRMQFAREQALQKKKGSDKIGKNCNTVDNGNVGTVARETTQILEEK